MNNTFQGGGWKMERHEAAVNQFMEGYRCSQAVLAVFAEDFGMDEDLARKISLPLAGGSGVGGECGAVSGAFLVLGLKYGFAHPGDHKGVEKIMDKVNRFVQGFKSLHGEIDCPRLIGLDVFSEEGLKAFMENNVKATTCARFVGDTVKILEKILSDV
jgi:C_GCAxxG_C_C family probable redox protein